MFISRLQVNANVALNSVDGFAIFHLQDVEGTGHLLQVCKNCSLKVSEILTT